jgi:hypothetical protein
MASYNRQIQQYVSIFVYSKPAGGGGGIPSKNKKLNKGKFCVSGWIRDRDPRSSGTKSGSEIRDKHSRSYLRELSKKCLGKN